MFQQHEIEKDKINLLKILKRDAYFKEKIILSSGKESDYYIDARRVTLGAEGVYYCARLILNDIRFDEVDAIGGPTLGADPMVGAIGALSFLGGKPVNTFIIRKEPKKHGKQQQIEGPVLKEGANVVIIDDVATTGKAFLQSLDVLEKMNINVIKAICIVDRDEGAKDALLKRHCRLTSIFNIADILNE